MEKTAINRWLGSFAHLQRDDGQALVEFALVAPLLLMILFGVLDFGKAFNYWNTETQIAEQGGRIAAVNGGTTYSGTCANNVPSSGGLAGYIQCQAPTSELRNGSSGTFGATQATVTICSPATPPAGVSAGAVGQPVRVTVRTHYTWLPLLNVSPLDITGSATMRIEQPWPTPPPAC